MNRFTLDIDRTGANGSAVLMVTVADAADGARSEAIEVTQAGLPAAAARLAGMMPGATAADVEQELRGEFDDSQQPAMKSVAELCANNPELHAPVIHGLLRECETGNLISAPKKCKSWLVHSLAIAVACGKPWLGRFQVAQGNVLIIDNELHAPTIANRLPKVASAMGVELSSIGSSLFVEPLRGRLRDVYAMDSYFRAIEPGRFKLVIVDAFYRMLPRDVDENSNADLANIYNAVDRYAAMLKSAFVMVHHSSKGIQSAKSVTDVGSGGSSQSRAADAHIVLRQHEEDNAVVMDAAVRSFAPIAPFCLRWDFPAFSLADDLDPTKLRRESGRAAKKDSDTPDEPAITWTANLFAESFISDKPEGKAAIIYRATDGTGLSTRAAEGWLQRAEIGGIIHRWKREKDRTVYFSTTPQEGAENAV